MKIMPKIMDVETEFQPLFNYVVIEYDPKQNEKTPSGIFAPVDILQHEIAAEHIPRVGIVRKLPRCLHFDAKRKQNSMRWKTTLEIEIGDKVWMNHLTVNDDQFKWNGKQYKLVNYEDIVCAKRGEEIVMVNGYMLLKPHYTKKKVLNFEREVLDKTRATVAYLGKPNKKYQFSKFYDSEDIYVGDVVVFNNRQSKKLRWLESSLFKWLDGNEYLIAQRYMVDAVLIQ